MKGISSSPATTAVDMGAEAVRLDNATATPLSVFADKRLHMEKFEVAEFLVQESCPHRAQP